MPLRHPALPAMTYLALAFACLIPPAVADAHGFTLLGPVATSGDRLPQAQVAARYAR